MNGVETRADRIAGAMYGAAIGDALGAAFEFLGSDEIERLCGEPLVRDYRPAARGSLLYPREPGLPTDDTALALSVAWIVAGTPEPTAEDFARGFLADLRRPGGRYEVMFWHGGPGGATTRALSKLMRGTPAADCGDRNDGGNGAAMRAHPVGALRDRERVLSIAAMQARTTHGHPAAVASAQAIAALVYDGIAGADWSSDVPMGVDEPTFARAWRDLHTDLTLGAGGRLPERLRNVAMSGWETVAAAHAIACCYRDRPELAIPAAVASGGDTDTVACIAGAIVGARHGMSVLAETLVRDLRPQREVAEAVAALQAL